MIKTMENMKYQETLKRVKNQLAIRTQKLKGTYTGTLRGKTTQLSLMYEICTEWILHYEKKIHKVREKYLLKLASKNAKISDLKRENKKLKELIYKHV